MSLQGALLVAVVNEPTHGGFCIGQGNQAIAQVPRWQKPPLGPDNTGPSSVIGHGNNGRKVIALVLEASKDLANAGPTPYEANFFLHVSHLIPYPGDGFG